MPDNIRYVTPKIEDPEARRGLLERIVASYISGIHHDDVIPDDCDEEVYHEDLRKWMELKAQIQENDEEV